MNSVYLSQLLACDRSDQQEVVLGPAEVVPVAKGQSTTNSGAHEVLHNRPGSPRATQGDRLLCFQHLRT